MRKFVLPVALLLAVTALSASAEPRSTQLTWSRGNLVIEDTDLSPTNSIWDDCPLLAIRQDPSVALVWHDDFSGYLTTHNGLTTVATDAGACAISEGAGGQLKIDPSDGTVADNDEAYVGGTYDVFTLAAGKDLWFEAKVKFTEANADDANIIVGLSTVYAANTLQDNGAGPPANYDGIVFFKVDGGTVWQGETSSGDGTQTTLTSLATRSSGTWTRLGIFVDGTTQATFYIDGVSVGTQTLTLPDNVVGPVFGVKNGGANEENLYVDYYRVAQLR